MSEPSNEQNNQPTTDATLENNEEKGPSKSAQKKAARDAKKAEAKASRSKGPQQNASSTSAEDVSAGKYGILPLIASSSRQGLKSERIQDLTAEKADQTVTIRARVHSIRAKGNLVFLVLRQRTTTVQAVASKSATTSKQFLGFLANLTRESIVDLNAKVMKASEPIKSTTQQDVELGIISVFVVSAAQSPLPILLEDAERPKPLIKAQKEAIRKLEKELDAANVELSQATDDATKEALQKKIEALTAEKGTVQKFVVLSRQQMLDNRVIDLRTPANQAIFRVQSAVCELFREYLIQRDFTEIHTPKLIGAASEGGADVFKVPYFDTMAYLAQSPQFYKQMAICADMERVFEIAPVYRAEQSMTHRHMTEFIGLDLEMTIHEHYHEALDVLGDMFVFIFDKLAERFSHELKIVSQQFPFEPLVYPRQTLRLTYPEAIELLREAGIPKGDLDDINTAEERLLGGLVRTKYNTDFYVIDKFPLAIRPFYTLPDPSDDRYSNSYDLFIRGQEICSGAQRIHDSNLLEERARIRGVAIPTVKDYIESFRYGAPPHAGGGIGLERVVMLYLDLGNIRKTSMFPRTPNRLTP